MDSNYQSVTNQAGIYAGEDGYDIEVGKNTDLKGAVIASKADESKNRLSTDTITYSDIENKAKYSASNKGVNVNTNKTADYNKKGVTPNIGVKVQDDAKSTTKSAISKGTLEVRSDKNKDLSGLSRDTENVLNKLGEIFDKKKVQEKQELAKVFGEEAFKAVHQFSKHEKEKAEALYATALEKGVSKEELAKLQADIKAWDEGGANKIILHSAIGGIMADLGGGNALSGAVGAGVNESLQKELKEKFKDNPDAWQWASAVIGTAAAKVAGGDAQTGASVAASGTKNNSQATTIVDVSLTLSELLTLGAAVILEDGRKAIMGEDGRIVAVCDSFGNWLVKNSNGVMAEVGPLREDIAMWPKEKIRGESSQKEIDLTKYGLGIDKEFEWKTPYNQNDTNYVEEKIIYVPKLDGKITELNYEINTDWPGPYGGISYNPSEYENKTKVKQKDQIKGFNLEIGTTTKGKIVEITEVEHDKRLPGTDTEAGKEKNNPYIPGDFTDKVDTTMPSMHPENENVTIPPLPLNDEKKGTKTETPIQETSGSNVIATSTGSLNTGKWNRGSFDTANDSLDWHFDKHGQEVGAKDADQYRRKAEDFARNLKGAQKYKVNGTVKDVARYVKIGNILI